MNDEERAQQDLALKVFAAFPKISTMSIAALRHFSRDQFRQTGKTSIRLCPPIDLYPAITERALAEDDFSPAYLHADEVRLARALGPRDPRIVDAVARTAFHPRVIETEYPESKQDVRFLARVTLAEFGSASAQWSEKAFSEISADDALGTSAAQIAIATDHQGALEKVSGLLQLILQQNPTDPIPIRSRDRFYELAYALANAGAKARPFAAPVVNVVDRKVESWAPPFFGILSITPSPMCRVLELVGGPESERVLSQEPCHFAN